MPSDLDPTLQRLADQKAISENLRKSHEQRWVRSTKVCKGIFQDQDAESTVSKVRNRNKIYFRKVWASLWRLVAAMYQAFLKDPDNFRIEGRDVIDDPHRAKVLQKMVEYRRDQLNRKNNLFLKFIWAYWDIFKYGVAYGKLTWLYKEDNEGNPLIDKPEFILYPPEQVFPDMSVETKDKMRYCHFLNYMTKGELEEQGYDNIDEMEATAMDSNIVRQTRFADKNDPLQSPGTSNDYGTPRGGEYPSSGKYQDESRSAITKTYKIYESFWIENGEIKLGVHSDFKVWAKKPITSPYGDAIPIIMGQCLTEPHQLIGEGFPEPLEAPQESFNYNLNMRKDNIAVSLSGHTFVSRYGNVDLQSLLDRKTNKFTLMDDVNAVKHEQIPDVTRSAYLEAAADEAMMDEMSGITPGKRGLEQTDKATVAQINYAESNAKIDLYIAIVGIFMSDFFSELTRQVKMFETDETVIRIANESFRKEEGVTTPFDIYDVDMEADCIINVGMGATGRDMEIKQTFLAMDRGIMTIQAISSLMQMGISPPEGFKIPNISRLYEDLLPKIGKKNLKEYFITLPPIQPQAGEGGGQSPALAGRMQPQVGDLNMPTDAGMIQKGGMGG